MTVSWSPPASVSGLDHYVVEVPGVVHLELATSRSSVTVRGLGSCARYCDVRVAAADSLDAATWTPVLRVWRATPSLSVTRHGARLRFAGTLWGAGPVPGRVVLVQRKKAGAWVTVRTATTRDDGTFVTRLRHRKRAYYRAVFAGGPRLLGAVSARHRR